MLGNNNNNNATTITITPRIFKTDGDLMPLAAAYTPFPLFIDTILFIPS